MARPVHASIDGTHISLGARALSKQPRAGTEADHKSLDSSTNAMTRDSAKLQCILFVFRGSFSQMSTRSGTWPLNGFVVALPCMAALQPCLSFLGTCDRYQCIDGAMTLRVGDCYARQWRRPPARVPTVDGDCSVTISALQTNARCACGALARGTT